jgi:hypothetical protein
VQEAVHSEEAILRAIASAVPIHWSRFGRVVYVERTVSPPCIWRCFRLIPKEPGFVLIGHEYRLV